MKLCVSVLLTHKRSQPGLHRQPNFPREQISGGVSTPGREERSFLVSIRSSEEPGKLLSLANYSCLSPKCPLKKKKAAGVAQNRSERVLESGYVEGRPGEKSRLWKPPEKFKEGTGISGPFSKDVSGFSE